MANHKFRKEVSRNKKIQWESPKIVKLGKIQDSARGTGGTCYSTGSNHKQAVFR